MNYNEQLDALDKVLDKLPAEEQRRIAEAAAHSRTHSDQKSVFVPKVYGALELLCMDVPPVRWVIKNVLPVGVTHFAGKEKSFKSFAALGLCMAASSGREYLGFRTNKCESLYFDLESSETRPRERMKLMSGELPVNSNDCKIITGNNLVDQTGKPVTLNNGFDETLAALLELNPGVRLVVIDVFGRIRSKRGADDGYTWDYRDVGKLKKIADSFGVAIIIINHVVKSSVYSDSFDNARGSGINAAVDCMWMLEKDDRSEYSGKLKIKGRDLEPQEYNIFFDKSAYVWKRSGTREEEEKKILRSVYLKTNILQTLEAVTKYSAVWQGKPSELIKCSYKTDTPIADDPKQLGMDLKKYEQLLRDDGFTFVKLGKEYRITNNNHTYKNE